MNTQNFAIYIHLDTKNKKTKFKLPINTIIKNTLYCNLSLSSFQKEELTTVNVYIVLSLYHYVYISHAFHVYHVFHAFRACSYVYTYIFYGNEHVCLFLPNSTLITP